MTIIKETGNTIIVHVNFHLHITNHELFIAWTFSRKKIDQRKQVESMKKISNLSNWHFTQRINHRTKFTVAVNIRHSYCIHFIVVCALKKRTLEFSRKCLVWHTRMPSRWKPTKIRVIFFYSLINWNNLFDAVFNAEYESNIRISFWSYKSRNIVKNRYSKPTYVENFFHASKRFRAEVFTKDTNQVGLSGAIIRILARFFFGAFWPKILVIDLKSIITILGINLHRSSINCQYIPSFVEVKILYRMV